MLIPYNLLLAGGNPIQAEECSHGGLECNCFCGTLKTPTLGAEYIVRCKGALIGKHFKRLAQVMPYLIYDLTPQTILDGWTVIGRARTRSSFLAHSH